MAMGWIHLEQWWAIVNTVQPLDLYTMLLKASPHTENIRGSNLAVVMCTAVQVSKTAVVDQVTSK
jgi:hypothetical protein